MQDYEPISIIPDRLNVEILKCRDPKIQPSTQIGMKVKEIGICGTDGEEAIDGRAEAPLGESHLIIGAKG